MGRDSPSVQGAFPASTARRLLATLPMDVRQERYTEALRQAALALGSEGQLAGVLGVEGVQLQRWLDREADVPLSAFLTALGVIADGPYAEGGRKVRVAAIRGETTRKRGGSTAS